MDSEGATGSVLICNPSTSLISPICCSASGSSVPNSEQISCISKPKKRRSKPKQRNAVKENSEVVMHTSQQHSDMPSVTLEPVGNTIEKTVREIQDAIDMIKNLQASVSDSKAPKKVRKRKKKSNEKEKKVHTCDGTACACDTEEVLRTLPEVKNRNEKKIERQFKVESNKQDNESPKHLPFFPDNRKGLNSKRKSSAKKNSEKEVFEDYLSIEEVERGLKDKTMVAGAIRINPRCYKEAYINSEGEEKDIMIEGMKARNRALEGDEVVVLINPPDAWKVNSGQRTGKVVYIKELVHSRSCIGKLPSSIENGNSFVVFSPRDARIPRIKIPLTDPSLPPSYLQTPALYTESLFQAQITGWTDVNFAYGCIVGEVGKGGDVEVETLAILLENNLDPRPINPVLNIFFPQMPYTIPEQEIAKRLDLRKECIFTIDPATAKDLDDAVSAKRLDNGNIEVGVHISDVAHFLHHNTLLDHTVSKRATTIYLVQRVYHMLPVELCHLCSLTPGEDKLAFSVILELTPDAKVVSHRFARSVIHSCAKLAYEHAQMVIDEPNKSFTSEDFPEIGNGFTAEDCATRIRDLYQLSVIMRTRRFASGALRIDQSKLCFHLDEQTQIPLSSFIYENKESHRLIEEFMLLANMTVAEHIYTAYPKLAFLRHHQPPRLSMMVELQKRLEQYGIHLDISNAGTLHSSIAKYSSPLTEEDTMMSWSRHSVLNHLCAKPMLRAKYFYPAEEIPYMHHYALNAPYYTHFTSPIRRYADVMVHRLLAASLGLAPEPTWTYQDTKRIADICNRQKVAAKIAGEQSSQLFLALYLQEPVDCSAVVVDVKDRSADVLVKEFGINLRVYTDPLKAKVEHTTEDNMPQLYIQWEESGPVQLIQLFSVVRVQVARSKDTLKLSATLLPPLS